MESHPNFQFASPPPSEDQKQKGGRAAAAFLCPQPNPSFPISFPRWQMKWVGCWKREGFLIIQHQTPSASKEKEKWVKISFFSGNMMNVPSFACCKDNGLGVRVLLALAPSFPSSSLTEMVLSWFGKEIWLTLPLLPSLSYSLSLSLSSLSLIVLSLFLVARSPSPTPPLVPPPPLLVPNIDNFWDKTFLLHILLSSSIGCRLEVYTVVSLLGFTRIMWRIPYRGGEWQGTDSKRGERKRRSLCLYPPLSFLFHLGKRGRGGCMVGMLLALMLLWWWDLDSRHPPLPHPPLSHADIRDLVLEAALIIFFPHPFFRREKCGKSGTKWMKFEEGGFLCFRYLISFPWLGGKWHDGEIRF